MGQNLLLVGLGGGIGSMARWIIQRGVSIYFPSAFPIGTFCVNIAGCFVIGIIWTLANKSNPVSEGWQNFLMAGLCGGFTTFSAYTLEGVTLLKENKEWIFLAYISASVILGLLATFAGMLISK